MDQPRDSRMNMAGRDSGPPSVESRWARFWHQPSNVLWLYVLLMVGSLWFWHGAQQVAQERIPYSEFLQHLNQGEVKDREEVESLVRKHSSTQQPGDKLPQPGTKATQRPGTELA